MRAKLLLRGPSKQKYWGKHDTVSQICQPWVALRQCPKYEDLWRPHYTVPQICEILGRGLLSQICKLWGTLLHCVPNMGAVGGVVSETTTTTTKIRHWGLHNVRGDVSFIVNRGWKWRFRTRQTQTTVETPGE